MTARTGTMKIIERDGKFVVVLILNRIPAKERVFNTREEAERYRAKCVKSAI